MFRRLMILLSSPFHLIGLRIRLMIVADEVQKTVHREMCQVMQEDPVFILGLALERLVGNDNIAKQFLALGCFVRRSRERQHVCRLVYSAPVAIERGDRRIVGEHDTHFSARC